MLKHTTLVIYRIFHNKVFLCTYLLLIPIVMGFAIYLTHDLSYRMQIAVTPDIETVANEHITYVSVDETPKLSQLVLNQYDAIVEKEGEQIQVTSTKGTTFDQTLPLIISGQLEIPERKDQQRGTATSIIGFLLMIISLLGVQIYSYYYDERRGINKRILLTAVNCRQYMLSHFIVALGFLYIPAAIVISFVVQIFHISIAIPMTQLLGVLFLLCFFASSFGLWINSLTKSIEESMMFGNMFAIVASIISGGFAAVTNNEVFQTIVQLLPQKQMMSLLEALEHHTDIPYSGIIYVIACSFFLICIAIQIEKKKLPSR